VFARRLIPLNYELWANISELTRTLLRVDKLGVTGSSLVPPTQKPTASWQSAAAPAATTSPSVERGRRGWGKS